MFHGKIHAAYNLKRTSILPFNVRSVL